MNPPPLTLPEAPGRVLPTMERDGSRRWLYPRLALGRFWHGRRAAAYALLALFTLIPFARIGGRPVLLLDVVHRRFTIGGVTFLPTDMAFLALFALAWIVSIFLFTALLGRVWCGWVCPQTVYLEYVFRPIERLFCGRAGKGGRPPADVAGWRKTLMYLTYAVICLHLANTFLAYFVPADVLTRWITSSPAAHPTGFAIVVVVAGAMMFNFAWFREQTCVIACPYGRLQSVLLDRQSLVISYDVARGEPRSKLRVASCELRAREEASATKGAIALPILDAIDSLPLATRNLQLATPTPHAQLATPPGDCIDCTMCVQVCPTGIDIRDGLQVECVACAQCIDACDAVMDKIGRPRGLIRYASQAGMAGEPTRLFRPRVVIYSLVAAGLATLLAVLLANRAPADVTVLRGVGRPFVVLDDGRVENDVRVTVTNRTESFQAYRLSAVAAPDVVVALVGGDELTVPPGESRTRPARILVPAGSFALGRRDVTLRLTPADGRPIDRKFRLLGPATPPTTTPAPVTRPTPPAGESHAR